MEPVDPTTASEGLSWLKEINLLQGIGLAVFLVFMIIYVSYILRFVAMLGMLGGFFGVWQDWDDPETSPLEGGHLELLAISFVVFLITNFIVRRIAKNTEDDS